MVQTPWNVHILEFAFQHLEYHVCREDMARQLRHWTLMRQSWIWVLAPVRVIGVVQKGIHTELLRCTGHRKSHFVLQHIQAVINEWLHNTKVFQFTSHHTTLFSSN